MYREFIDEFVLSPSMRQYLKTVDLSVEQITQLIYFSPVLLQQKKQAFYRLRDLAEKNQDEILKKGVPQIYFKYGRSVVLFACKWDYFSGIEYCG